MTFEPEAFDRCVNLVKNSPETCSPYRSEPHSDTCAVCKMDKNLYDLVLEQLKGTRC